MLSIWSRWLTRRRSKSFRTGRPSLRRRSSPVRLGFELLETRDTPAGIFTGGGSVAVGDGNGDGFRDIITGAGAGGAPIVRVLSGQNGQELNSLMAYDAGFTGGVSVAAGDVDGDGKADIITGAGPGGVPVVEIFSGATGSPLRTINAFDGGFSGGLHV